MTLVLAMLLSLVAMTPAFADETPASGAQTLDTSISVSGLGAGDKVDFYQVLKFDADASATGGWAAATGFNLSTDQIQQILGLGDYAANGSKAAQAGISAALAGTLGDMAEAATAKYANVAAASGTATQSSPEAGLYIGLIKPGTVGWVYNPVFVGADYKTGDPESSTVEAVMTDTYSDKSLAKKEEITLDKTASTTEDTYEDSKPETVAVGDTVTFTVKTTIPEFGDNYTSPVFKITDALSAGLKLKQNTIIVYPAATATGTPLSLSTNYTVDDSSDSGYTISFVSDWIKGLNAAQPITVTYEAEVTNAAATSINKDDNTVTVNYSNSPTDTTGKGILKDKTNHYTFDIDADLFGNTSYKATEVVKVGLDKNGNEITETKTLSNGNSVGALQGAEFKLYTDAACTTPYVNGTTFTADTVIESDADGRLTVKDATTHGIRGLDAGTYYLKETKAPEGYIKAQQAVKIEIVADIQEKTITETVKIDDVDTTITYKTNELVNYSVKIDGVETAKYTFNNDGTAVDEGDKVGDTNVGDDANSGKIKNTQGVELPSTGGMGTTILYTVGGILIAAGGIWLVTKKRLSAME